ncbi:MAG TPA: response regulator [Myxococcota bacterium]|nr:response regulator [Myxococcota bacterium]
MNNGTTLLMTEDDPGHAALLTRNLRNAGVDHPVLRFGDGGAVLDFLLGRGAGPHRDPDGRYLLLLDIRMPRVDGLEVLRTLRGHPATADLPVIVVTTTDDPRDIAACGALGCLDYVVKSVRPDRFRESMDRLAGAIRSACGSDPAVAPTRPS